MKFLINILVVVFTFFGVISCAEKAKAQARLPNIVVILADDLGYGDIGAFNSDSKIPTPHIDQLASEGMIFTDAHTPFSVKPLFIIRSTGVLRSDKGIGN